MRLILTRHGETEENLEGRNQGHLPGTLTQKGIEQARKLALRLKKEPIDVIYSSDLKRAADTTKEIAAYHNVPINYTQELRENYTGAYQGKLDKDCDWSQPPDDAETAEEFCARAQAFLKKVLAKHDGETVLIVAHGGIVRAIEAVLHKKPAKDIWKMPAMKHTAITIYDIHESSHALVIDNCTRHLEQ